MTKQEAARILRTEHLGDSEWMELAKQMGARALECQCLHYILPACEKCGCVVPSIEIEYFTAYHNIAAMTRISPASCPNCGAYFAQVIVNCEEQTVLLKGAKETKK